MRKRIIWALAALFLAATALPFLAFKGDAPRQYTEIAGETCEVLEDGTFLAPDGTVWKATGPESWEAPTGEKLQTFRKDTLTNTANDTLLVSGSFVLPYQTSLRLTLRTLSGTRAVTMRRDQSNTLLTGVGDWTNTDSLALAAGLTHYLDNATTYGRRVRYRLDGNAAATQSIEYTAYFFAKPTVRN